MCSSDLGDEVIGIGTAADDDDLVFITDNAQLLRFSADAVRPQGRTGGGVAGVRLAADAEALFFGVIPAGTPAEVVTVAGNRTALPGTVSGTAKVTNFDEFPAKGRGTGGVRAHRFLKGEDTLYIAAAVPGAARALVSGGNPLDLPETGDRRDGSGTPVPAPIVAIG